MRTETQQDLDVLIALGSLTGVGKRERTAYCLETHYLYCALRREFPKDTNARLEHSITSLVQNGLITQGENGSRYVVCLTEDGRSLYRQLQRLQSYHTSQYIGTDSGSLRERLLHPFRR